MFNANVSQLLLRWLRRYDREFDGLLAEKQQSASQIAELQRQKALLEKELVEAEQDTSVSAAYRERLDRELAAAAARNEELQRQNAALAEEIRREPWAAAVLDDDFIAGRISPQRKHAWLVAAPKSGSTWLTAMLTQLLGWQPHILTAGWDRREQEIDVRRMLDFPEKDLFSMQQHCRYSVPTRDFLRRFRVQVILQGRNLYDSVVSLRDHFLRESTVSPVCFAYEDFPQLPSERQLDLVIDLAVPWYLSFYASWFTARQAGEVDFCWVSYESLRRDLPAELRGICGYLGVSHSDAEIEEAMQKAIEKPIRLNVGRSGRGDELLTQAQKDRVARLRAYFPLVDFSPVGL